MATKEGCFVVSLSRVILHVGIRIQKLAGQRLHSSVEFTSKPGDEAFCDIRSTGGLCRAVLPISGLRSRSLTILSLFVKRMGLPSVKEEGTFEGNLSYLGDISVQFVYRFSPSSYSSREVDTVEIGDTCRRSWCVLVVVVVVSPVTVMVGNVVCSRFHQSHTTLYYSTLGPFFFLRASLRFHKPNKTYTPIKHKNGENRPDEQCTQKLLGLWRVFLPFFLHFRNTSFLPMKNAHTHTHTHVRMCV